MTKLVLHIRLRMPVSSAPCTPYISNTTSAQLQAHIAIVADRQAQMRNLGGQLGMQLLV